MAQVNSETILAQLRSTQRRSVFKWDLVLIKFRFASACQRINSEFGLSILILMVQGTSMSFKSWFGALEDAGGSWLGFGIWIMTWIWSLIFDTPMLNFFALHLDFEGGKITYVLKSRFGIFDDAGCSWLGFYILIFISIWSLVSGPTMFHFLATYLAFAGAENIHVL